MLDHDPVMAGRKHEALRRDRQEQVARHGRRNCQGAPSGIAWLTGGRSGRWAMTINGPWRLVFRFKDGDAVDVEIVDYH
jgi:hypothetical protein